MKAKSVRGWLWKAVITFFIYGLSFIPVHADLIGYWKFDEGTGTTIADETINGNDGTFSYMDSSCWVTGKIGDYALEFDGNEDYVVVPHDSSLNVTSEVTVEAWIKPDTGSSYNVIACKGTKTYFLATYYGRLALLVGDENGSAWNIVLKGQTIMDSTKWYHVAGTYKNGVGTIYVNGIIDGIIAGNDEDVGTNTSDISIGSASSYASTYFFNGTIDELRIYNNALNNKEIKERFLRGGWHFDETTGTDFSDFSEFGNDGNLYYTNSPPCWIQGIMGNALEFDGSNYNYGLVPHSADLDITDEMTIEAWVKPDTDVGNYNIIACKGRYTYFFATVGGQLAFLVGKGSFNWNTVTIGDTVMDSSKWYHVTGVYEDGVGKVYVNGVLDGTDTGEQDGINFSTYPLSIGSADSYTSNYYFDGVIDELKIYNRAFTGLEIRQRCFVSDLCGSWEFDDGSGTIAADSSGKGNNGNLTGALWVDGRVGKALELNGSSDYVNCGNDTSLEITQEISIEAWVKPDIRNSHHVIACKGSYTYFLSICYGTARLLIGKQDRSGWNIILAGSTSLDNTKWYHIVGTYKEGVGKIYVNGVLDGTETGSNENIGSYNASLSIGSASSYSPTYYFQGLIDQVNIFSRELSSEQITARFTDHGGEYGFGSEEQPTGDPIGGGSGYSDILSANDADYDVDTVAELKTALSNASSGDIIFVSGDIDLTGDQDVPLTIPGGVILAGNRGYNSSSGALLKSDTLNPSTPVPLFVAGGQNVRITGLRIQGPHSGTTEIDKSRGIQSEYQNLEVDNCEISAWGHAGIFLDDGATDAYIHHNYIHHCQRDGLGYGISHGYGYADSLVEANKFDYYRHAVAATGTTGNSYEARYNLALENATGHVFDMHGGADRNDGTNIAGDNIYIHHNTVKAYNKYGVNIRGIPNNEALIYNNWFAGTYSVIQSYVKGNLWQYLNLETEDLRVLIEER